MKKFKTKVLVLGNCSTGKTSLLQSYCSNGTSFPKDYVMTQACEITSKILPNEKANKDLEYFFFDVSGHELYDSFHEELFKEAKAVIYVFDVTNEESFQSVNKWKDLVQKYVKSDIPSIMIGNKIDLNSARTIDMGTATNLARSFRAEYFETSAVTICNP